MTTRSELDRWLEESQWLVERDPEVGGDAMRWRPEPLPAAPFHAITAHLRQNPLTPRHRSGERGARLPDDANALWLAIGQAYRNLADA